MGLNTYSYDDISIGQTETFNITVTDEMQEQFHKMSGDINPMHINEQFAQSRGFNGRVVYGMLVSAFYSTLVGTLLPGKKCLFHGADIEFRKPVYIGDELQITGKCIEKNDTYKLLTIKARIKNNDNETVSSAKLRVGVLK